MVQRRVTDGKGLAWPNSIRAVYHEWLQSYQPREINDKGWTGFARYLRDTRGIGVNGQTIRDWCNGRYIPTLPHYSALAKAFGWGVVELAPKPSENRESDITAEDRVYIALFASHYAREKRDAPTAPPHLWFWNALKSSSEAKIENPDLIPQYLAMRAGQRGKKGSAA